MAANILRNENVLNSRYQKSDITIKFCDIILIRSFRSDRSVPFSEWYLLKTILRASNICFSDKGQKWNLKDWVFPILYWKFKFGTSSVAWNKIKLRTWDFDENSLQLNILQITFSEWYGIIDKPCKPYCSNISSVILFLSLLSAPFWDYRL